MKWRKGRAPSRPSGLRLDESPALERIVSKCLETDRDARYQRAADIRDDLQRLKQDTDSGRGTGSQKPASVARRSMLIAAVTAVTIIVSASAYFYLHRPPKLTDNDTVVLADFDNTTGDPVFDDTLRQGLSVELQQSPFLNLISDRQVQQQLALMGQPKEARLTSDVAEQICERTASAWCWKARSPALEASMCWACAPRTATPETFSIRSRSRRRGEKTS